MCCCFFRQKTAYAMRSSDSSSDVGSSDRRSAAGDRARPVDDQRHPHRRLVEIRSLEVDAEIAEHLTVIRHEDHDRVLARPGAIERVEHPADQLVRSSWRERVCQYVSIPMVAASSKKL